MDRPQAVLAQSGFPTVGIGASAGGIEALEGFRGMPDESGLSFEAGGIRCRLEMALQPQFGEAQRGLEH